MSRAAKTHLPGFRESRCGVIGSGAAWGGRTVWGGAAAWGITGQDEGGSLGASWGRMRRAAWGHRGAGHRMGRGQDERGRHGAQGSVGRRGSMGRGEAGRGGQRGGRGGGQAEAPEWYKEAAGSPRMGLRPRGSEQARGGRPAG